MMKQYKGLFAASVLLMFCALFPLSSAAAQADTRLIRIAYPIQEGLTEIDEEGYYTGYTFEYLEKIAQNTGWDYEYVTVPGTLNEQISTLMDMVEAGEVDLMGGMVYNEAAAERFTYCGNRYGTSHTVLQVLKENYYYTGHGMPSDEEEVLRIAIMSASGRMADDVTDYCRKGNIQFSFVECGDLEAGIKLLKEEQADALASSEMFVRDELQVIAGFAPNAFYFVTGKQADPQLIRTLDTAIINVNRYNPTYQLELYSKYFNPTASNLSLSKSEQEYIASLPSLKVGVSSNRPPFQHYDEKHKLHGICIDILDYISVQTGLSFELVDVQDRKEQYAMLQEGKLDLILGAPYDYAFAREYGVLLSEPYAVYATVLVTGKNSIDLNHIEEVTVALVEDSYTSNQSLPDVVKQYETTYECLKAVQNGEVDCSYQNQLCAQLYLNEPEFSKLKIATFANRPSKMSFALSKTTDSVVLNIINRSIATMTSEFQNGIVFQYFSSDHEVTLRRYLQENPSAVIMLLCVVAVFIVLFLILNVKRRGREARLAKVRLEKHLNLCALAGDIFVEYDFKQKHLMASCPSDKYENNVEFFEVNLMNTSENKKNQEIIDAFTDILKQGASEPLELQIPFLDGNMHWVELTVSKVCDENNEPLYSIARLKLIDKKFTAQEKLRHQAQMDGLTQLYNIEHFNYLVQERLEKFSCGQTDAFVMLDIDYFKKVNDTYGHMEGNEVLQKVAALLKRVCPDTAIIGRMGGDEFVIYLSCVSAAEVEALCRTLCAEALNIRVSERESLSFSIGAVIIEQAVDQKSIFEKADAALYDVKRGGRNSCKVTA